MVFFLEGNDLLSFLRCGWCAREAEVDITHWQALEAQFLREQELIYDPLEQVPIDVVNTSMKTPTPNFEEFTERWEVSKGTRKTTKEINELTTKRKRIANERIQKLEKLESRIDAVSIASYALCQNRGQCNLLVPSDSLGQQKHLVPHISISRVFYFRRMPSQSCLCTLVAFGLFHDRIK